MKGEQPSAMSDVYALGMVFLEVSLSHIFLVRSFLTRHFFKLFTLAEPFSEYKRAPQVVMHVYSGGRPRRPTSSEVVERGMSDSLWFLMEKCWREEASSRPKALEVREKLLECEPVS